MKRIQRATGCRYLMGLVLLVSSSALGQTVRPLINELANPAKSRVEYVNDGLIPLNVVLEAKSFSVSEKGEISYRPLDANIHLRLSTTSFRIQPKQTYYVFYEASANDSPAWFVIYAAFSGFPFRTAQGMNVRLELPHTVYLLPKQSVEKSEVHIARAVVGRSERKVVLEVENTGANFGRVLETQLVYAHGKQEAPGFPLFPHSKRIVEVPLEDKAQADNVPVEVLFQLRDFKVQQKLEQENPSPATNPASAVAPATGTGTGSNP